MAVWPGGGAGTMAVSMVSSLETVANWATSPSPNPTSTRTDSATPTADAASRCHWTATARLSPSGRMSERTSSVRGSLG